MQIKNKKEFFKVLLISTISIFVIAIFVKAATTIGTNITTTGTLSATGLTTMGSATSTSATTTKYIMVGSAFGLPSSFDYNGDLSVSSDLVVNNKATSTVALWVGSAGTANSINLTGGDLYVENDAEIDGTLYGGAITAAGTITLQNSETITNVADTQIVFSDGTNSLTFDTDAQELSVSGTVLKINDIASTTDAIFSGNATTTGNMVIGYNKQATTAATTTVTLGSYDTGGAGNGVCLKFWQGGGAIYCVPSLAGITCSATSCE